MVDLKKRLRRDRPMTKILLRMPEDVLEELSKIAKLKDMGSAQALIRFYVGQGLREDLIALEREK